MMSAYMPDFSTIETGKVYQWVVDLENEMSNKKKDVAHTNETAIKWVALIELIINNKTTLPSTMRMNSDQ